MRGVRSSALQEALSGLVSGFGVERCSCPPLHPSHSMTPTPPSTSSVLQALYPNFGSPASARDALEFPTGQRQHRSPSLPACPDLQGPLTAFQFPKLSPIVTSVLIWSKQKHLVQTQCYTCSVPVWRLGPTFISKEPLCFQKSRTRRVFAGPAEPDASAIRGAQGSSLFAQRFRPGPSLSCWGTESPG